MYYSVCKPIEPAPVCEPVRDAVDTNINVLRDVNKPVTTNVETEKSEKQASKEQEEKTKTKHWRDRKVEGEEVEWDLPGVPTGKAEERRGG